MTNDYRLCILTHCASEVIQDLLLEEGQEIVGEIYRENGQVMVVVDLGERFAPSARQANTVSCADPDAQCCIVPAWVVEAPPPLVKNLDALAADLRQAFEPSKNVILYW
jgi:hypothetical protein